jgi:predicted Ser/Thr protein kinase
MAITDPLVLPDGVVLVPVETLPDAVRAQLSWQAGDWAISRPGLRTPSRLLDASSAELVRSFSEPITIVEAVVRYTRSRREDAERALEEAFPLLQRLWLESFLAEAGSESAERIHASLGPGELAGGDGGWEIVSCIQMLADSELYLVRGRSGRKTTRAALKIERRPAATGKRLEREAAILSQLAGSPAGAPRLLDAGEHEGRRYLACEWCAGVDAATAAGELRQRGGAGRAELLALLRAVLGAFASLHARGVVHGDVHPRNVLVSATGGVHLIDFGLAASAAVPGAAPERGGVGFFFEPEFAAAGLGGVAPPQATSAGEQYALGALLYLMASGEHYLDFSLERERMLRQIVEQPPLPFSARGVEPWPELESLLARALAKESSERFASLSEMLLAAERLRPPGAIPGRGAAAAAGVVAAASTLLARVLARADPEAELFAAGLPAPSASITSGAAGLACALYRIAAARGDAALLSQADLWCAQAARLGGEEAFYNRELDITPQTVGRISPYHTASGVWAAAALVAHARHDYRAQADAVERFIAAVSTGAAAGLDLTLGRSGVLLAVSLLLAVARPEENGGLISLGEKLLGGLWRELDTLPPASSPPPGGTFLNLGVAHGWAGCLYATLGFCRRAGAPLPPGIEPRLAELAAAAEPWGRGLRWRWYGGGDPREAGSMAGWCNGSAGLVFLWTLAERLLGDPEYGRLAEGAAWNAWEADEVGASLCCGLAGRAYALLNLHRHQGGPAWLERAHHLAERAARSAAEEAAAGSAPPNSLYKGEVGVAALVADLERPDAASLPFFEDEGWPLPPRF